MDASLKQRLVGATVLIALAVIFLPMLVKGPAPDSGVSDVPLDIPAEPGGNGEMVTRDLPLTAPGPAPVGGALGMPVGDAATSDAPGEAFPTVAAGDYVVSFGSYATAADADKVIAALRAARLTAYREDMTLGGRTVQRVRIGPFADRAVAESARIEAARVNGNVGAKVVVLDAVAPPASTATAAPAAAPVAVQPLPPSKPAPAPATSPPAAAPSAAATVPKPVAPVPPKPVPAPAVATPAADAPKTGFAVQVGAFAAASEASALRDRLRSAGFNAFTESVKTDKGTLTRVRVGPAMNRAEADALKSQVKAKAGIDGIVRPHP